MEATQARLSLHLPKYRSDIVGKHMLLLKCVTIIYYNHNLLFNCWEMKQQIMSLHAVHTNHPTLAL